MVIPLFARQKGRTVLVYVIALAALTSLGLTLLFSHKASAVLPISNLPIVGQPVADVLHVVTDDVAKPLVNTVTGILPEPVGAAVQRPVNAVTQAVDPIIGPATQPQAATPRQSIMPQRTNRAVTTTEPLQVASADPQQLQPVEAPTSTKITPQSASVTEKESLPPLASFAGAVLGTYFPAINVVAKNFATSKDASAVVAAGSVLLAMTLAFTGLIAMIIRTSIRAAPSSEHAFMRRDLAQASTLILCLFVAGSVSLFMILSRSS